MESQKNDNVNNNNNNKKPKKQELEAEEKKRELEAIERKRELEDKQRDKDQYYQLEMKRMKTLTEKKSLLRNYALKNCNDKSLRKVAAKLPKIDHEKFDGNVLK